MLPQERNPRIERVQFELRARGVKPEQQVNSLRSGIHSRGYLPHVKREGSRYFVTFRLDDSLPEAALLKIKAARAERLKALYARQSGAEKSGSTPDVTGALQDIEREYFRKLETYLDKGHGECYLRRPDIAELVAGAIRFFEGQRYHLSAWVVMPNHVHAVLWPMANHTLSRIVQTWKRYTGREANKLLGRTGRSFWQPEPYDHWIRNDVEHARCCRYVVNNPVKARLCPTPEAWKWSSACQPPS